jgi:hypothetical protein
MSKSQIKEFLNNNKGYLKWGKKKLARKFNTTQNIIVEIKQELLNLPINKGFKRLFFDIETSPISVFIPTPKLCCIGEFGYFFIYP